MLARSLESSIARLSLGRLLSQAPCSSRFNSGGYGWGGGAAFAKIPRTGGSQASAGSRTGGRQASAGSRLRSIDWSREQLNPIKKDLYEENAAVSARPQAEIDEWIKAHQVNLEGHGIPRPVFEFGEVPFRSGMVDKLSNNFQRPTVIQSISWPIAMSGRDVISIAKTGSGKTLAFMLPGLMHTIAQAPRQERDGPSVVVLLPTRELAQQVHEVSADYCKALGLKMTCCFGGADKGPQAMDLKRGVDVIVATPGRLLDFVDFGTASLRRCSFLVLDEADRMLDMGFEPQIKKIVSQIRPDRQTMMFSATWPKEVRALASGFQKEAAFLNVGSLELAANHNITQHVEVVNETEKQGRLMKILTEIMQQPERKTLIFVQMKRKADEIARWLKYKGFPTLTIHGDKSQYERDQALKDFKTGKSQILLATDVAARGLDVDDIKFVINHDYSKNSEDYVHRIGRTGRRDKKGTSYTFLTPDDAPKARDLIKILVEAKQTVPAELEELANTRGRGGADSRARSFSGGGRGMRPSYGGGRGGSMERRGGRYGSRDGGYRSRDGGYGSRDGRSGSGGGGSGSGGGYRKRHDDYSDYGVGGRSSW